MFTDVEEIEENFWACGRLPKQFSDERLEQDKVYEQQKSDSDANEIEEGYTQWESDSEFHSQHAYVSHSSFYSSLDLEINSFQINHVNDYYGVDFVEENDEFVQRPTTIPKYFVDDIGGRLTCLACDDLEDYMLSISDQ
jgi:hypothetical protein